MRSASSYLHSLDALLLARVGRVASRRAGSRAPRRPLLAPRRCWLGFVAAGRGTSRHKVRGGWPRPKGGAGRPNAAAELSPGPAVILPRSEAEVWRDVHGPEELGQQRLVEDLRGLMLGGGGQKELAGSCDQALAGWQAHPISCPPPHPTPKRNAIASLPPSQ